MEKDTSTETASDERLCVRGAVGAGDRTTTAATVAVLSTQQNASSASFMESIDRMDVAGGNAPAFRGKPKSADGRGLGNMYAGDRSSSLEYDDHEVLLMLGTGTPPSPPTLSTQLAAVRPRLGDLTNAGGGNNNGDGVRAKQEAPSWHDQRADGPACDVMRVDDTIEPAAATKRPDGKKSKKRWLGIARSSRKTPATVPSSSSPGAGGDGAAAAAQLAAPKSAKLGRRRSFSLRRSKSVGSGDRYSEAARAAVAVRNGFPSPAAGVPTLSFRTDGQAGQSSGDALSHMLFGMDLREPETLQTMNKYFLELQKENIRLESAESILSHENTEIIRENEELKQRWAAAEKEAQMAIAEVRAVQAKNDLLEQQVEALEEELDSPTFI